MRDRMLKNAFWDILQAINNAEKQFDSLTTRLTGEETHHKSWSMIFKNELTHFYDNELIKILGSNFYVLKFGDSYVTKMSDSKDCIKFETSLEHKDIINFKTQFDAEHFLDLFENGKQFVSIVKIHYLDLFNDNNYKWWECEE